MTFVFIIFREAIAPVIYPPEIERRSMLRPVLDSRVSQRDRSARRTRRTPFRPDYLTSAQHRSTPHSHWFPRQKLCELISDPRFEERKR